MTVHSRFAASLAVMGVLALAGASAAWAQEPTNAPPKDTSAAAQSDTSGYRGYRNPTDSAQAGQANARIDSSGFKYTGLSTDTALKAPPGVQTGPTSGDSSKVVMKKKEAAAQADTLACKDGSNAPNRSLACAQHGGIDWAATRAAMKARGKMQYLGGDSAAAAGDTSTRAGADREQVHKNGAGGYQYTGSPADTALRAKPGTQTGADTGAAGKSDTSGSHQNP